MIAFQEDGLCVLLETDNISVNKNSQKVYMVNIIFFLKL